MDSTAGTCGTKWGSHWETRREDQWTPRSERPRCGDRLTATKDENYFVAFAREHGDVSTETVPTSRESRESPPGRCPAGAIARSNKFGLYHNRLTAEIIRTGHLLVKAALPTMAALPLIRAVHCDDLDLIGGVLPFGLDSSSLRSAASAGPVVSAGPVASAGTDPTYLSIASRHNRTAESTRPIDRPEIDIKRFYWRYCRNRSRPLYSYLHDIAASREPFIGFNIEVDPDRKQRPSYRDAASGSNLASGGGLGDPIANEQLITYISFFVRGWGAWFTRIDGALADASGRGTYQRRPPIVGTGSANRSPSRNEVDDPEENLASVQDFLDQIAGLGIALVAVSPHDVELLRRIWKDGFDKSGDLRQPTLFSLALSPSGEQGGIEERCIQLGVTVMQATGIDILSWQVRTDERRLSEEQPKNPISKSFCTSWSLRAEQMSYIGMRAYFALELLSIYAKSMRAAL